PFRGTLLMCLGTLAAVRANGLHIPPSQPNILALLAGIVARVKCPTSAPDGAHAAGLRFCRAAVMQPDAAPLSFRGSCKPLALAMGFMTPCYSHLNVRAATPMKSAAQAASTSRLPPGMPCEVSA